MKTVSIKYGVYEFSKLTPDSEMNTLVPVKFKDPLQTHEFDSEFDAVQALIENNKVYQKYTIIKQFFIR